MSRPARDGAAERQGQRAARSNGDGLSVRQIAVSGQVPPRLCPGQGGPLRLVPFVVQDGYPQDLKAVRPGMEVGGPDHRAVRGEVVCVVLPGAQPDLLCQRPLLHGQHETAGCAVIGVAVLKDQDDGLQPRGGKGGGQQPGMAGGGEFPSQHLSRCPGRPPPQ